MGSIEIASLFHFDALAAVMAALVVFVAATVAAFAARYLRGDARYARFFLLLALTVVSVTGMVSADNLLLMLAAWGASNVLLVTLMVHKPAWNAARYSGRLAASNFALGFACVAAAFGILYAATGSMSIQAINDGVAGTTPAMTAALLLLIVAAMTQCGIWPFHRWLTSSLNSPTPVSAVMHAGLVNGGGFLLARFAPLYFEAPQLLTMIFVAGLVTALLGTLWKLMQNDIKRMLACSTMGQMGFMLVQCGLGLFPAAVAHLCWHGLFKANLFLASGGSAREKRLDPEYPPTPKAIGFALACGVAGSYGFALASQKPWVANDTTMFLVAIALFASIQFALPILRPDPSRRLPLAFVATALAGGVYGLSIYLVEYALAPLDMARAQPLNPVHVLGLALLGAAWLSVMFVGNTRRSSRAPDWLPALYVKALNASQPHSKTVTTHRNDYRFL